MTNLDDEREAQKWEDYLSYPRTLRLIGRRPPRRQQQPITDNRVWVCGRCGKAPEQHATGGVAHDCLYEPVLRGPITITDEAAVAALAAYYDDDERAFTQASVDRMRAALEAALGHN